MHPEYDAAFFGWQTFSLFYFDRALELKLLKKPLVLQFWNLIVLIPVKKYLKNTLMQFFFSSSRELWVKVPIYIFRIVLKKLLVMWLYPGYRYLPSRCPGFRFWQNSPYIHLWTPSMTIASRYPATDVFPKCFSRR